MVVLVTKGWGDATKDEIIGGRSKTKACDSHKQFFFFKNKTINLFQIFKQNDKDTILESPLNYSFKPSRISPKQFSTSFFFTRCESHNIHIINISLTWKQIYFQNL